MLLIVSIVIPVVAVVVLSGLRFRRTAIVISALLFLWCSNITYTMISCKARYDLYNHCGNCGGYVGSVPYDKYCGDCGVVVRGTYTLAEDLCPECDTPIDRGNEYCVDCGTVYDDEVKSNKVTRIVPERQMLHGYIMPFSIMYALPWNLLAVFIGFIASFITFFGNIGSIRISMCRGSSDSSESKEERGSDNEQESISEKNT